MVLNSVQLGTAIGSLTFFVGDLLIDRYGGGKRNETATKKQSGTGLAIFLGTLLDGIPESLILGMTLSTGGMKQR